MNPTSPDAGSSLAALRQLKEMLDAGTITQPEFDALKQRLIFGADPAAAASPPPAPSSVPTVPPAPYNPPAVADALSQPAAPEAAPPTPYLDTPAALTPEAAPLLTPEPDWLAAPAPALLSPGDDEPAPPSEAAERRNPLNLIFALGGLVLFLAVVAYLVYDRRPDERITSQTQTAADSAAVAPEVGPQAEQLTLPPATAPETIRVAPALPPATLPAAPDSVTSQLGQAAAPAPAAATPKPAASAKPAPVAKPTTTNTTDSAVGP